MNEQMWTFFIAVLFWIVGIANGIQIADYVNRRRSQENK